MLVCALPNRSRLIGDVRVRDELRRRRWRCGNLYIERAHYRRVPTHARWVVANS